MPRYKNGIKLYDNRTDIINAFVYEDITTKNPEAKLYGDPEKQKSEIKFEESAVERTDMRRKKSDEENQEEPGLKTLTSDQMPCRLPITLGQLK